VSAGGAARAKAAAGGGPAGKSGQGVAMLRRGDLLLAAAVLAAAAICAAALRFSGRGARQAVITVDGQLWGTLSLAEDARVEVARDGMSNVVVVEGGKARMESANCPDKLCVRQGAASEANRAIVCLPNRVVVKLERAPGGEGGGGGGDVDAVAG